MFRITSFVFGSRQISAWMGRRYDSPRSKKDIASLAAIPGCRWEEAEKPLVDYASFNDFFTRRLKPGARPLGEGLVSPADGRLRLFLGADADSPFPLKGATRSLRTFAGYTNDATNNANIVFDGTEYKDKTFPDKNSGTSNYTLDWPQTDGKSNPSAVFSFNGKQACMIITITEAASDKLSAPTFSYDEVAGKVTINAYGAKEIRYTTDGSEPSATNGTVYSEPFEASNITVKAIAISDGTKSNSNVATYQVPAKLLSTSIALTKVTIAGVELSAENLQKLLTDKTLALTEDTS